MERLYIDLKENSYYINIDENLLASLDAGIADEETAAIITDENVNTLYGEKIETILKYKKVYKIVIPAGERSKSFKTVEDILNRLLDYGLTRRDKIIAIGGGVVGDIAGFIASIYMRGVDYVQLPTTLLSQVDSSVGGKTGINMVKGKNTVGSFYQPKSVIIDTEVLKTLSKREIITGVGEIIKYGIIYDYEFLKYIDENFVDILNLDKAVMKVVIKRCCAIKAEIVSKDERESDFRKILNFGHTIGHGLETISNYEKYTHGEAVIIGIYYEAKIAASLGYIKDEYLKEIISIIKKTEVPLDIDLFSIDDLISAMMKDKKNRGEEISFILPIGEGKVRERFFTKEELIKLEVWDA